MSKSYEKRIVAEITPKAIADTMITSLKIISNHAKFL